MLITADGAWRRGSVVALKDIADEALAETPSIEHVLVLRRTESRRRDASGPRPLVARRRRPPARRVRARVDGRRGPALHPLHVGHDRQAQGHHAHDRRLPHAGRVHAQVRVRPEARHRRLLVHRRRRLGHRPLLHRLRAAREPGDLGALRRHPRPPRQGPALVDRREVQGDDLLHRAHRDPDVHEVGRRPSRRARPVVAAPDRHGRRADQPRGLGLVLRHHRRRPLPGRRHVVADRDRRHHDQPAARRDDAEARQRDLPAARASKRASSTTRASPVGIPGGGYLVLVAAVAVDAARHLGRRAALPRDVLVALRRQVLRRRRRQARRRRLLLAARPGRRHHARRRPQHLDDRGGVRARRPPLGRGGGGRRSQRRRRPARPSPRS